MKIEIEDFEIGSGIMFTVSADNETERVLLMACAGDVLTEGADESVFSLTLGVDNG